jgi:HPt (histidine-containing phosphotransfer) domain-containing protein
MSDDNYFDEAALEKLRQLGGDKFVHRMIDMFFDYAPKRLAAARAGEQADDLVAIAKGVHPLKSSAGQLGARRVQELAAQIEKLATAQEAAALPPLIEELEAALAQIKPRLEQVRKPTSQ